MLKNMVSIPKVILLFQTNEHTHRDILHGVLDYERIHGPWSLRILEGRQGEPDANLLKSWGASAVIGVLQNRARPFAGDLNVPTLLIDPNDPEALPLDINLCGSFFSDAQSIGELAADFFLERGFTQFAFVGAPIDINWSRNRAKGFHDRLAHAGFSCHNYATTRRSSDDHGALRAWLKRLPCPTALFSAWDVRAREILDICLTEGIHVPSDLAVLGVDNESLICETTIPTLSSIELDSRRMGYEAASFIDNLLRKKRRSRKAPIRYFKPLSVMERGSTEIVNHPDPVIRKALEFIWLNAHDPQLSIPVVAAHAGVSRRTLEMRFRQMFGKSPLDELHWRRLNRAKNLLSTTHFAISELGKMCGFVNSSHLGKLFRATFGTTMTQYRRNNE